jgi:hypothetical protein
MRILSIQLHNESVLFFLIVVYKKGYFLVYCTLFSAPVVVCLSGECLDDKKGIEEQPSSDSYSFVPNVYTHFLAGRWIRTFQPLYLSIKIAIINQAAGVGFCPIDFLYFSMFLVFSYISTVRNIRTVVENDPFSSTPKATVEGQQL